MAPAPFPLGQCINQGSPEKQDQQCACVCVCVEGREVYGKELAHMVAGWQSAGQGPRMQPMVQLRSEGRLLAEFLLGWGWGGVCLMHLLPD